MALGPSVEWHVKHRRSDMRTYRVQSEEAGLLYIMLNEQREFTPLEFRLETETG